MGDDILRNSVRLSSANRSRPLHIQPLDPYADTQASPAPTVSSNERRHHRRPLETLRIPSSESLRPEPPLASHQSLRVHRHHSEGFRHDCRDRRSESLAPPGPNVSHQVGSPHHLRAQPHEKPRDPEKVEGENWLEETHTGGGSISTHHTTIHYPSDNCDDGSGPEDHSVWILVMFYAAFTALDGLLT